MQAPFADPLSRLDVPDKALPLVDRASEMQVIRLLLNTVALNLPVGARALMISGEMGVGKTRVLAELYTEARGSGFRVLEGRSYESSMKLPYFPFFEALRPVLRSSSVNQLRYYMGLSADVPVADIKQGVAQHEGIAIAPIGMPLVAALARLFPELPRMLDVTIMPEILSPDQEKFRFLEAVATLLERMAEEQPLLLGIDNLQWADSASLELTMYLTVRLHRSSVALVGSMRPQNMQHEHSETGDDETMTKASNAVSRTLGELMRQSLLLLLPVGPLDMQAASQYLHELLPETLPQHIARTLLARAEGNPFFLEELVRTLTLNHQLVLRDGEWRATKAIETELPGTITLAVKQRLQKLSSLCCELLRVAALFGRTFPLAALLKVQEDKEERAILSLIEEAKHAAIIANVPLADDDNWYEYTDDREEDRGAVFIRPVTTAQLTSPTYMFCQGIVQEVLSAELELSAQRTSAFHGAIGAALEVTYGSHMAAAHAAELARHYMLGGNKADALRWNLLAGKDAAHMQAHREAIGHFRLALRLLEDGETSQLAPSIAGLHCTIGELWFKLGELEQATQAFHRSLELLHQTGSVSGDVQEEALQLAQVNRLLGDVYRMQGRYDQALAHLQAARTALVVDTQEERNTQIAQAGADVPWFPGRSFASDRGALTLKRVNTIERILLLQAQATLDILLYRKKEAETALWQSHQLATEIGDRGSQAFALHLVGWLRGWGVHIHEAIRLQEQAHQLYIAIGDPFRAVLGDQGLGIIYQALGETERAHLYTAHGFERARRYGVRYSLGWLHWNFGVIALTRADWSGSTSHLQEAMREAEATENARLKPIVLQALAELSFRQGRWHEAETYFQESIRVATNTEWYPSAMALYGHFLAVTGRRAAAKVQLDRAAACLEPLGYGGDFYIPFLAEGYLHLEESEQATGYIERIRSLRGFMYYGNSVDRILGVVATLAGDWAMAELAFEDGVALCRRANNQPEEAAILYEWARTALLQSRNLPTQSGQHQQALRHVVSLCSQARTLFLQYTMQRAVDLVDTLQAGVQQLEQSKKTALLPQEGQPRQEVSGHIRLQGRSIAGQSEYHLDLNLTRREQEVLRLVAEGHTDREVAEILVISPRTVNRHLSNMYIKLDVPGRAGAVAFAIRQGLV